MIKVLNNREELDVFAAAFRLAPDFAALYRENVNANITDFELALMDSSYLKRACAAAIWRNNNIGINAQSRRRLTYLKRFICSLCGITAPTFYTAVKAIKSPTK